jgi:hypothetical protein
MPYKSKAQQGFMHGAAERGEISRKVVKKFDRETKGRFGSLPARLGKKKSDLSFKGGRKMSSLTGY